MEYHENLKHKIAVNIELMERKMLSKLQSTSSVAWVFIFLLNLSQSFLNKFTLRQAEKSMCQADLPRSKGFSSMQNFQC